MIPQAVRRTHLWPLLLALLFVPAQATTVEPQTLGDLIMAADRIQRVRVLKAQVEPGVHLGHPAVLTHYAFEVQETFYGDASPHLSTYGGEFNKIRYVLHGQPTLEVGREYLLFLHDRPTQSPFCGISAGVFELSEAGIQQGGRTLLDWDRLGRCSYVQDNETPASVELFLADLRLGVSLRGDLESLLEGGEQ